jgi:uncharacterized protein
MEVIRIQAATLARHIQEHGVEYQVIFERDPSLFWARNKDYLMANESAYNLPVGLLMGIISSERSWGELSLFTVTLDEEVVGMAMHTGGDKPINVTRMPSLAVEKLVKEVVDRGVSPEKVAGPTATAKLCAELFRHHNGGDISVVMRMGIYELVEVTWPKNSGGSLICAQPEHREIAERFAELFVRECFPNDSAPIERSKDMVERLLPKGHIFFWKNSAGEFVSIAARNRETPNTTTISLVYTPSEQRARGYARLVVAHLSQLWLDRGKLACNLLTDLTNPASNRAYTSVGYRQISESRIYRLHR